MTVDKKLIVGSAILFLLNAPISLMAANVTITQTINPGGLEILSMPTDMTFPPLRSMRIGQTNFVIPEIKEEVLTETTEEEKEEAQPAQKILIQDKRFDGGFRLEAVVGRLADLDSDNFIPVENIGVVTFHQDKAMESLWRGKGATTEVIAPANGDPLFPTDYKLFKQSASNPSLSEPLTILDGTTDLNQGRIGFWETYPAFMLKIPPSLPKGRYQGSVTYTFLTN